MKKSFLQLIERANDIEVWLGVCSYIVNHFESGSYVDFRVSSVSNLPCLVALAEPCNLRIHSDNNILTIRIYEREEEDNK